MNKISSHFINGNHPATTDIHTSRLGQYFEIPNEPLFALIRITPIYAKPYLNRIRSNYDGSNGIFLSKKKGKLPYQPH